MSYWDSLDPALKWILGTVLLFYFGGALVMGIALLMGVF